jgi:putative phosphoserine phosphatase / 1-acylglycerol-3-phosphate O-acyltransferase
VATAGTVADVEAAESGPSVLAVFDLDGTLVDGFTASALAKDRLRNRQVTRVEVLRAAQLGVAAGLGRSDYTAMLRATAQTWMGRTDSDIEELGERLYQQRIAKRVLPAMRLLVEAHLGKGHTVVIASSATRYQVEPVARALGVPHVLCSQLEVVEGVLTGEVRLPVLWGDGKVHAVQEFAHGRGIEFARSFAYADGDEDVALLHLVGNPRAVNPKPALARVAQRRGWPVLQPALEPGLGRVQKLRNVAGTAALVPAGLAGVGVGLLTWNRRRGLNVAAAGWFDAMMLIDGIGLRVVGAQHLREPRPAVFIFNHVNNFDPMVVAKLVRHDYTGVAKRELRASPIVRLVGEVGGVAFLDREDPKSAVAALQTITARIREGTSVIIAPEGTRSSDGTVGEFRKGAFRMAIEADVPIIPVVVRNILDVADRDAIMVQPGRVDVAVLPPIPVGEWTVRELPKRIAEVRQQFVDTLQSWPDPTPG